MVLLNYHQLSWSAERESNSPLKDATTSWFTLGSWGSILNHRSNHTSSLHDAAWLQQSAVEKREWEGEGESEGGWAAEQRRGGRVRWNEVARRQTTWASSSRDSQGYNPQSPDCNLRWHHATVLGAAPLIMHVRQRIHGMVFMRLSASLWQCTDIS